MRERGKGTLLFTTGGAPSRRMPNGPAQRSPTPPRWRTPGCSTTRWARAGIHVAHTAIVGGLGRNLKHDPADIAELLWRQHVERRGFQHVVE